jgi:hypothetical protein
MKKFLKKPQVQNILSALAVAFFGSILLNLIFILDWAYQSAITSIVKIFTPLNPNMDWYWYPPVMHFSFIIILGFTSWFVFKSKLKVLFKAIFMLIPVTAVMVTIGMFTYQWPIIGFSISILLYTGILYYLYRSKQHWLYYYAVILVGIVMAISVITGSEI